jgi:hypothetical protein
MATLLEASAQEASAQEPPITNDNPIKLCIKLMADLDSRSDCIVFAKREWNLARVIRQCNADPSNRQLAFSGHYLEREKLVGDYVDLKSDPSCTFCWEPRRKVVIHEMTLQILSVVIIQFLFNIYILQQTV